MDALLAAIMSKTAGSALSTALGGRIFLDEAPAEAEFPYMVFFIVTSSPEDTFKDQIEDTLIQFSLRSISKGAAEITGLYTNLKALFKNATLTVTGGTTIWMEQRNLTTNLEEITTPAGTMMCRHWAVDYSILVQAT